MLMDIFGNMEYFQNKNFLKTKNYVQNNKQGFRERSKWYCK